MANEYGWSVVDGILQLNGISFAISSGGVLSLADGTASAPSLASASQTNRGLFFPTTDYVGFAAAGVNVASVHYDSASVLGIRLRSDAGFSWSSTTNTTASSDVNLFRDAANILAQRNGTNAQTWRLYTTFTDASNYERLNIFGQAAGDFVIQPANAGTGTLRALALGAGGVMQTRLYSTAMDVNSTNGGATFWRFNTSGQLLGFTATGGLGYTTGAGGAVTQITSRTTGVTLNTITGDITLISAAGSATAASFTVTNSAVAVTDNIIINQKSGTNLYNTLVTTVGAGSFVVTFFTTGGVAVDAPVFHFSVIKGAIS